MLSAHGLEYDHVDSLVSENLGCCNEMAAMRLKGCLIKNLKALPEHYWRQERQTLWDSEAQKISWSTRFRIVDESDLIRQLDEGSSEVTYMALCGKAKPIDLKTTESREMKAV